MGKGGKGKGKGKGKGRPPEPEGPPDQIEEIGEALHTCEDDLICKCTNERIPHFNARMFLENKEEIGKVDEIFGPINSFYFSVKMGEGMKAASFKDSVLVFMDGLGLAKGILEAAPKYRLGTKQLVDDCSNLTQEDVKHFVEKQKQGWDLIIFAYGMEPPKSNAVQDIIEQQDISGKLYLWILQAVQRAENPTTRIAVLTRGVFTEDSSVHRQVGLQITVGAHLFGMTNSARQELDEIPCPIHYVDTEWSLPPAGGSDPYKLVPRIASEIFRHKTFGHNSVRVTTTGRYVMRRMSSKGYEVAHREFKMPTHGIIAISGGNGALGLVMGEWLLDQAEKHGVTGLSIRFLSRSAKIADGDNLNRWNEIQSRAARLGIGVEQIRTNFGSQEGVDDFVKSMKGQLSGFIHSAGMLADSMLKNLNWEKFETVWNPKHRAALYLHSALERHEQANLKFLWVFSSVAVYGNMGHINYSGSNAVLDGLARYRKARGKPCVAIQWGAWGEVGMAANLNNVMRKRAEMGPEPYFLNAEGIAGLEAGLRTGLPVSAVTKLNKMVIAQMTAPYQTPTTAYTRHFYSEVIEPAQPITIEREHTYTAWAESHGSYRHVPGKHQLVYSSYIKAFAEENEEEWGDDFCKWSKP